MKLKRLVPVAAVLAATLAAPTAAAADPVCASVGYTVVVIGSNDVGTCVPWITQTAGNSAEYDVLGLIQVRRTIRYPWIFFGPR